MSTPKHGTRSGDKPPRSSPSLAFARSVVSLGRKRPRSRGKPPYPQHCGLVSLPRHFLVVCYSLVSAQATPSLRSGVAWADTTVSSSFLLLHGTAVADNIVVWCSDHQSESTCSTKHGTRSGDKPPRSSPSLAVARSVGSSGSDVNKLPSLPSSQKAVSAPVLTSSYRGRLFCVRGLRPLTHAGTQCRHPMWAPNEGTKCGHPMWAPNVGTQ